MRDALWTAWSWYRFLREAGFALVLAVDGNVSTEDSAAAARLFPDITVLPAQAPADLIVEQEPSLKTFLALYPTGRKLALLLALSAQYPVIYSDSDVLAFARPEDLLHCVAKNIPCYFMEEVDGTRDPFIIERAQQLGLDYLRRFNSGFLYLPQGSLPIKTAVQILDKWQPPVTSWFTEQTVLSVMLHGAKAEALPPDRYVISARRQFYWQKDVDYSVIAARHFTGTVRHVMYRYGMPVVLKQGRSNSSLTHDFGSDPN